MTIWITILVLVALFATIGFFNGAIRTGVMLVMVALGGFLAVPVGHLLAPLFPKLGLTANAVHLWIWPVVAAYVLLVLIAFGLSFAVYQPVAQHYKYRATDYERSLFLRLDQRLGLGVGLLCGVFASFWLAMGIYVPGYVTTQFANPDQDPIWLKYINAVRNDTRQSGLDRLLSRFDPAPKKFYEAIDLLALLYNNNPAVVDHLKYYPPFLTWNERQEFVDWANDKEFTEMLQGKPSLATLIANPRTLALINNSDLIAQLMALDLADLRTFVEKSKTPKYEALKIVGRWELDGDQVVINARKKRPDASAREMRALKEVLSTMAAGTTIKATTDNRFVLTTKGLFADVSKMVEHHTQQAAAKSNTRGLGVAPSALAPAVRQRMMDPAMAARYGIQQPAQPAPDAPPAEPAEPPALKLEVKTYDGAWEGEGDTYTLKLKNDKGVEESVDGVVEGDYLTFQFFGFQLVFVRL